MLLQYDNSLQQINSTNERLFELQSRKTQFYEKLNLLNHEVRIKEKEKSSYIQNAKNLPEIMKRIDEVREEISKKLLEKSNLELENITVNEKYTLLLEKQKEFMTIITQSQNKHNDKISQLNNLRIKLQIDEQNLEDFYSNNNSNEENRKALEYV